MRGELKLVIIKKIDLVEDALSGVRDIQVLMNNDCNV